MPKRVYRNAGYGLKRMSDSWFKQPGFRKGARKPLLRRRGRKRSGLF